MVVSLPVLEEIWSRVLTSPTESGDSLCIFVLPLPSSGFMLYINVYILKEVVFMHGLFYVCKYQRVTLALYIVKLMYMMCIYLFLLHVVVSILLASDFEVHTPAGIDEALLHKHCLMHLPLPFLSSSCPQVNYYTTKYSLVWCLEKLSLSVHGVKLQANCAHNTVGLRIL